MIKDPEKRPVRGRPARQERSERARSAIAEGVVAVLASHGAAGLTHRRVAEASGTSLAATTYYFATKGDMVAEASNGLLARYLDVFAQAAAQPAGEGHAAYVDFISRVAANGLDRDRAYMLSWYEIMLDGTRDAEARALAKSWYASFDQIWRQRAKDFGLRAPQAAGPTGVDLTVGAMIHGLSLGWAPRQYTRAVTGKLSANTLLGQSTKSAGGPADCGGTRKSRETRERLRDAAIALLAEGGAGAVTYRAVATRAGLSPAAPVYHFSSSEQLLAEAQGELFERQKARYREVVGGAFPGLTLEVMTDLTAVIFQREATEFGGLNVAGYAIWLEASRKPDMRVHVRPVMSDLYLGWRRLLTTMGVTGGSAFEAMCIQFLFVGAQLRVLASGASSRELVAVMGRLKDDISALAQQRHWLQSGDG